MRPIVFAFLAMVAGVTSEAQVFLRPLPDAQVVARLTAEQFNNADAVIIMKEQVLSLKQADIDYHGEEYTGTSMTTTTILLVKVFTEAGIRRFGSYALEYVEPYGDEIPSGFSARARVLKPDGKIITMPEADARVEVSRKSSTGIPLARKAIFKVPDLAAGDLVQVEYTLTEPFARTLSGIFYYNDRVPTIFSNLAVTLLASDEVRVFSFPPDRVGEPKVSQVSTGLGAGPTYFWNLRNPNPVPQEPYANTFEDLSLLTAFVADRRSANGYRSVTDWNSIAKQYFSDYVDRGSLKNSRIQELGFSPGQEGVTWTLVDSLYTALRRRVSLVDKNSLYPLVENIDDIFERRSGDASDLAYVFYKILQEWKVDARAVWIRDRRTGVYESTVPSVRWFDRLAVLVTVAGSDRVFDFDKGIPLRYESPWFLQGVTAPVLSKKGCEHKALAGGTARGSTVREEHDIWFTGPATPVDRMVYAMNGAPAVRCRERMYDLSGAELEKDLLRSAAGSCLTRIDTSSHSSVLVDPEISVTCTGPSKAAVTSINNFLSMKLPNQALQAFRDEIFTPVRSNDLVWDGPTTIAATWRIRPPSGQVVHALPRDTSISAVRGFSGSVAFTQNGEAVTVRALLTISGDRVPVQEYPRIIGTLDGLLASCGQSIVFKKK